MIQIPVKKKYQVTVPGSRYKSTSNDSVRRRTRRKVSDKLKLEIQASQPRMVLVLLPSGKKRMRREDD